MDSGNTSGSMQSSSGGDEEYDSRAAESISALLTTNNNHHTQNDVIHQLPNPHHHHHHHQSAMFDPLSNFFDPVSSSSSSRPLNPNPLLNLDIVWPKPVRSDPNSADLVSFIPSSQPNFLPSNHQLGQTSTSAAARSSVLAGASSFPAMQIPPEIHTTRPHPPPLGPSSSSSADRTDAVAAPNGGTRNPKKRSRASRRAPTTVLTTDTTNFRAMVQEFTGIPAPPFTSSPSPRTRLDLFGSGSTLRSLDPSPSHHHNLLRPFAQKFQQTTPFVNAASSTSSPPPQNSLLNINQNNPVLSFHSLLQNAPPKFPILPKNMLEQDQFGLSHGNINVNVNNVNASQLGGLPNHHPTTTTTTSTIPAASVTVTTTANWGSTDQHGIMGSNDNNNNNGNNGNDGNVDEGLLLRSINGGYTSTSTSAAATNGHKLNYSASSSTDFHGSKTEINLSARSEGMVESWICSSD